MARAWPLLVAMGAGGWSEWARAVGVLRASSPAVPDDWHARMWTVFKEAWESGSSGDGSVQIHLKIGRAHV